MKLRSCRSLRPLDPKIIQSKVGQLDQMKKDYQRRGEDGQAAYQRRRQEIFGPLRKKWAKPSMVTSKRVASLWSWMRVR